MRGPWHEQSPWSGKDRAQEEGLKSRWDEKKRAAFAKNEREKKGHGGLQRSLWSQERFVPLKNIYMFDDLKNILDTVALVFSLTGSLPPYSVGCDKSARWDISSVIRKVGSREVHF